MNDENFKIKITKALESRINELDPKNIKFGTLFTDHMVSIDCIDGVWQMPEILPFGKISFNPGLASLHYGQAIFEGMKAFKNSAGEVSLFRPKENLRPFMFATEECIKSKVSSSFKFMIIMSPAGPYFSEPVRGKVETEYIRSAEGGVGFTKCAGNYAAALYPYKLAQDAGYTQLFWTDAKSHKNFEESGTMNLMFVKSGKILTPKTSSTILKGITRDSLIEIAKSMNIEVEERDVSVEEIITGIKDGSVTEIFGIGTAVVVAPFSIIGQNGTDYSLPEVNDQSISSKLKDTLRGIRIGEIADKFGWMSKVE